MMMMINQFSTDYRWSDDGMEFYQMIPLKMKSPSHSSHLATNSSNIRLLWFLNFFGIDEMMQPKCSHLIRLIIRRTESFVVQESETEFNSIYNTVFQSNR